MPVIKNRVVLEVVQGARAFLSFEAGATRGAVPDSFVQVSRQELGRMQKKLAEKNQKLQSIRQREARKDREIAELRKKLGSIGSFDEAKRSISPRDIIWIFGSARTGSTWLASMLSEFKGNKLWNEPHAGRLFGQFYYNNDASQRRRNERNFIMGGIREPWLKSIRFFVLEGAEARFPKLGREGCVIIKEPNGSIGAPLLSEALPESRLVLLVRDPRDVVASTLDASKKGGWRQRLLTKSGRDVSVEHTPDELVSRGADQYQRSVSRSREAYEVHQGPKSFIRYEDLRVDTLEIMKQLCADLGLKVSEKEIGRAVDKYSWESIPQENRGEGKFHRKAKPGGWQEDLTPEQIRAVEKITAPLLEEFYPESASRR